MSKIILFPFISNWVSTGSDSYSYCQKLCKQAKTEIKFLFGGQP